MNRVSNPRTMARLRRQYRVAQAVRALGEIGELSSQGDIPMPLDLTDTCWAVNHGGARYEIRGQNICHDRSREHCHCFDQSGSWERHEITCPLPKDCTCATRANPSCPIHKENS